MSSLVIVTGATGFLAQYVIKKFIDEGYKVIGTVRSQEKGLNIVEKFSNPNFSFEVIEDLANFDQVHKVVLRYSNDLKYFIHTAAAMNIFSKESEKDLLIPNINATTNILKILKQNAPNLEKFVYTSSISAFNTNVMGFDPVNEESWSSVTYEQGKLNGFFGYSASKKFSEREIFQFVQDQSPSFKVATIGASMILGAPLFKGDDINGAAKLLLKSLKAESEDKVEPLNYLTIAVEDVAKAHYVAATNPEISNQRLLISSNRLTQQDVLDAGNEFTELQGKIPKGVPKTEPVESETNVDNKKSIQLLGFKPELTTTNLRKIIKYAIDEHKYL